MPVFVQDFDVDLFQCHGAVVDALFGQRVGVVVHNERQFPVRHWDFGQNVFVVKGGVVAHKTQTVDIVLVVIEGKVDVVFAEAVEQSLGCDGGADARILRQAEAQNPAHGHHYIFFGAPRIVGVGQELQGEGGGAGGFGWHIGCG